MPRKTEYVVRVVIPAKPDPTPENMVERAFMMNMIGGDFLDCLRYAGFVHVHHDNEERQTFDLLCPLPKSYNNKVWAEQNAARMRSFGYNAVVAPRGAL